MLSANLLLKVIAPYAYDPNAPKEEEAENAETEELEEIEELDGIEEIRVDDRFLTGGDE